LSIVLQRPLGDSGLNASVVALGTWAMGGTVETWGRVDDNESIAATQHAIDCGINLIDTASIYGLGHSEQIVGKAISGRRDQVLLATKCGLLPPAREGELPSRCLTYESILRECEASLRRLRTDVIDLYQCHWPDPETPIRETMRAMTTLLEQGKIRAIGVSNFSCEQIAAAREFAPVHCVQPEFSMLQTRASEDLIPYCREHGIAVIAYSPLCKGLLTGKFNASSTFTDIRAHDPQFVGDRFKQNLKIVAALTRIAAGYNKTVAQLAVNWVVTHPGVTAAIVGAKRPSQVTENVGGVGWTITEEDRGRIEALIGGADLEP
jgi:aryl-alcohol dehydrogenase-like predicted oxidoreductase